jgi:hypothetical protein
VPFCAQADEPRPAHQVAIFFNIVAGFRKPNWSAAVISFRNPTITQNLLNTSSH